jgi:hypothetical protein
LGDDTLGSSDKSTIDFQDGATSMTGAGDVPLSVVAVSVGF